MKTKLILSACALLALALLPSCQPSIASPAELEWPIEEVVEIRVYRTNWDQASGFELILDGDNGLNAKAKRMPEEGIVLNAEQTAQLHQAMFTGEPFQPSPHGCLFVPHHAFVFLDANQKVLGSLDICFNCLEFKSSAKGFDDAVNYDGLKALFGDLNVPIRNPEW